MNFAVTLFLLFYFLFFWFSLTDVSHKFLFHNNTLNNLISRKMELKREMMTGNGIKEKNEKSPINFITFICMIRVDASIPNRIVRFLAACEHVFRMKYTEHNNQKWWWWRKVMHFVITEHWNIGRWSLKWSNNRNSK